MEKPLRRLAPFALVAVVSAGCASSAGPTGAPQGAGNAPNNAPNGGNSHPAASAAPSSLPYPDVSFQHPGTNPAEDPRRDNESTFAMDVDTASYAVARRFLNDGNRPDPSSVRPEEFVNSFELGYEHPRQGTFAVHIDGGQTPFLEPGHELVRIGIAARDVREKSRPDAALTFVIDVSGSMGMERRLETVKSALERLLSRLRPSDRVGIVVYGSDARIELEPQDVRDGEAIVDAVRSLHPEGSTNAAAGLRLGYDMARSHFLESGINRVILCSDGVANVGVTDAEGILRLIRSQSEDGIQLVTVGFGMGNYNDTLMEQLADNGDGFYAYVDTLEEAEKLFVDDLTGTLLTVAQEAKVQVVWDPAAVASYRLIGFENRAIADRDFTNDRVDAGEVGAGHTVTALYDVELKDGAESADGTLGEVRLRWREPEGGETRELNRPIDGATLSRDWGSADRYFRLAATVAEWAEVLRESRFADEVSLRDVASEAEELLDEFDGNVQVNEFVDLARRAARLSR